MSDFNDFELDEQLRSIAATARDRVANDVRNQLPDDDSRPAISSDVLPMEPRPNHTLNGSRRWWSISAAAAVVAIAIGGFVILNGGDDEGMISPATQPPGVVDTTVPTDTTTGITGPPPTDTTVDDSSPPDATDRIPAAAPYTFDTAEEFGDVSPDAISIASDASAVAATDGELLVLTRRGNMSSYAVPDDIGAPRTWIGADDVLVAWGNDRGYEFDVANGKLVSELTLVDGVWTRTFIETNGYRELEGRPNNPLDLSQVVRAESVYPIVEGAGCSEAIYVEGGPIWTIAQPADCEASVHEIAPLADGGYTVTLSAEIGMQPEYHYVLSPDGTVSKLGPWMRQGTRVDTQGGPHGVHWLSIDGTTARSFTMSPDTPQPVEPGVVTSVPATPAPTTAAPTTAPPTTAPQNESAPEFLDGMRWERTDLPADCAQQQPWPGCQFGHTLEGVLIQADGDRLLRHDSSEPLSALIDGLDQGWFVTVGPDEIAYLGLPPDGESGGNLIAVSVARDDFGTVLERWPDLIPLGDSDLLPSTDGLRSTGWYGNNPRPDLSAPAILEWLERDDANTLTPPDIVYNPSSHQLTVDEQTWDLPTEVAQPIGYPLSLTSTFDGGFLTTMGTETLDEAEWLVRGWPNGKVETTKVTDHLQSETEWVKTEPAGTILVADPEGMIRAHPFEPRDPAPTLDPQVDVDSGAVTVPGLDELLANEDPSWELDPVAFADALEGGASPNPAESYTITSRSGNDGTLIVTSTREGFFDDSVLGVRHTFVLQPTDDGLRLVSATWAQRCQPDRGHQDYRAELCT